MKRFRNAGFIGASLLAAGLATLPMVVRGGGKTVPPEEGGKPTGGGGEKDCADRVTGGGWIVGTPSGGFANFGVGGGILNGEFWGHLNYLDHDEGLHVKATAVTGYEVDPNDPDCRYIEYDVTINDEPGTATVHVCDYGEPGADDIFEIELSTGYTAGGNLADDHPGGGNIQLHKPNCD